MPRPCQRTPGHKFPGGHRGWVTPVPIPNTEVKPTTADGTACAGVWESRSLPGLFWGKPASTDAGFFFLTHTSLRGCNARLHREQRNSRGRNTQRNAHRPVPNLHRRDAGRHTHHAQRAERAMHRNGAPVHLRPPARIEDVGYHEEPVHGRLEPRAEVAGEIDV